MFVCVCAISNICDSALLCDLARDRIDTRATSLILPCSARTNIHLGEDELPCVNFVHSFTIVYTQNTDALYATALNHFAHDCVHLPVSN